MLQIQASPSKKSFEQIIISPGLIFSKDNKDKNILATVRTELSWWDTYFTIFSISEKAGTKQGPKDNPINPIDSEINQTSLF